MPRPAVPHCIALLALLLGLGSALAEGTDPGMRYGVRIEAQPPRLAMLARQVQHAAPTVQWDFVNITLDVLLFSYQEELSDAATERASTPERRAKLARWRRATRDLVARLESSRARLVDGAGFVLYVDPQHQILIVIDGQPIAVSAPRPEAERLVEQRVLAQFCAFNDCSVLESEPNAAALPAASVGSWMFQSNSPPAFEIDGVLRCEFADLSERARKAEACTRAADEAAQFDAALGQAQALGHLIDWERLADTPPTRLSSGQIVVSSNGAFVELPTRMLSRLDSADWQRLIGWLQRPESRQQAPVVRRADRLLEELAAR
ncbi:MAG: hypothetical protein LJE59_13975 [Chromatiaceae bacterium]|nr:hypothetical protein [Chromatiaceae bacterium]